MPVPRSRRRSVVVLLVAVTLATLIAVGVNERESTIPGLGMRSLAYQPQRIRNAEIDSPDRGAPFTTSQINKIVQNNSYQNILNFADRYNIQKHFADARQTAATALAQGTHIRILEYFNASYWFTANEQGWQPYSNTFRKSYLLRDSSGNLVPFFGNPRSSRSTPFGYMIDWSNPAARAWAVKTIVEWMKAAPYDGIHLDGANVLIGNTVRPTVSTGVQNWNAILCGSNEVTTSSTADCAKVTAWNAGLTTLIKSLVAALHPMGDEVDYNGIAPAVARGESRNIGLLQYADIANNESFCYDTSTIHPSNLSFQALLPDIKLMQQEAAQGKKIFEITNWHTESKLKYGPYCLAGFLMGWQPGYDYWVYHRGYSDPLSGAYPYEPEQNLNLGLPVGSYRQTNDLLSREFENGYVAVNIGTSPETFHAPADTTAFAGGIPVRQYAAGDSISLPARGAVFLLKDTFVNPLR